MIQNKYKITNNQDLIITFQQIIKMDLQATAQQNKYMGHHKCQGQLPKYPEKLQLQQLQDVYQNIWSFLPKIITHVLSLEKQRLREAVLDRQIRTNDVDDTQMIQNPFVYFQRAIQLFEANQKYDQNKLGSTTFWSNCLHFFSQQNLFTQTCTLPQCIKDQIEIAQLKIQQIINWIVSYANINNNEETQKYQQLIDLLLKLSTNLGTKTKREQLHNYYFTNILKFKVQLQCTNESIKQWMGLKKQLDMGKSFKQVLRYFQTIKYFSNDIFQLQQSQQPKIQEINKPTQTLIKSIEVCEEDTRSILVSKTKNNSQQKDINCNPTTFEQPIDNGNEKRPNYAQKNQNQLNGPIRQGLSEQNKKNYQRFNNTKNTKVENRNLLHNYFNLLKYVSSHYEFQGIGDKSKIQGIQIVKILSNYQQLYLRKIVKNVIQLARICNPRYNSIEYGDQFRYFHNQSFKIGDFFTNANFTDYLSSENLGFDVRMRRPNKLTYPSKLSNLFAIKCAEQAQQKKIRIRLQQLIDIKSNNQISHKKKTIIQHILSQAKVPSEEVENVKENQSKLNRRLIIRYVNIRDVLMTNCANIFAAEKTFYPFS